MPILHFPERLQPTLWSVRRWLLTDAALLVILGALCLARGISYVGYVPSSGGHPAENLIPIAVMAWVWIVVGVSCLLSCLHPWKWVGALSLGAGVGLHVLWAISFLQETFSGEMDRGWVSALNYLAIIALVLWTMWRGSRADPDDKGA